MFPLCMWKYFANQMFLGEEIVKFHVSQSNTEIFCTSDTFYNWRVYNNEEAAI